MKFKRENLLNTIIAICVIVTTLHSVSAAPSVDIESIYSDVSVGDTFTVNIIINPDVTEIYAASYKLYFNNNLLSVQNQTKGTILSSDGANTVIILNEFDNTISRAEYIETRAGVADGITTSGILAKVEFKVINDGTDEFRLFDVKLSDIKADPISNIIVQSKDSTDFLVQGYVFYEDGSECNNYVISLTNLNIGMEWGISPGVTSNFYNKTLIGNVDIVEGDILQLSVRSQSANQSRVIEHIVTQQEIDNGGIDNFNITFVPETSSESDTGQSTSPGSSGSSRIVETTSEASVNIFITETERENMNKDSPVSYKFDSDGNIIQFINFTGLTNSGEVTSTIELLYSVSSMVDQSLPDIIYKNFNIYIGNDGWANSENIADPIIKFKVEDSWIKDNNIDESTIKLNRYSNGKWDSLNTAKISKDIDYLYFEAETPGFLSFAITGKQLLTPSSNISEMGATSEQEGTQEVSVTQDQTHVEKDPGFSMFVCVLVLLIAIQIIRIKEKN